MITDSFNIKIFLNYRYLQLFNIINMNTEMKQGK